MERVLCNAHGKPPKVNYLLLNLRLEVVFFFTVTIVSFLLLGAVYVLTPVCAAHVLAYTSDSKLK